MSREAGVVGPTPGEWKVGLECAVSGWVDLQAESAPCPHIIGSMRSLDFETNRANAELVVRAVNSHADLLAALDVLLSNARLIPDPAMAGATDCYAVPMDDIDAARAALARATGVSA